MMEMEVRDAAVVAADRAAAAGLGDEGAFDLLLPSADGLTDAALASPSRPAPSIERKLCVAVTRTLPDFDRFRAIGGWRSSARSAKTKRRRKAVSGQEHTFAERSDAGARLRAGAWPEGRAADF